MKHLQNYSLKKHNTFGIESIARNAFFAESEADILTFLRNHKPLNHPFIVLGGGSNVLLTADEVDTVMIIASTGYQKIAEAETEVVYEVQAGESWEKWVDFCVENDYSGLENLSLIPGSVGAAPMQNIGAYGTEVKECIEAVEAIDISTFCPRTFSKEECGFAYRSSVFKTSLRNKYIITSVQFRLSKQFNPNLSYSALASVFENKPAPTLAHIADAVKHIRRSKLPDPEITGNAGSFFKNPVISHEHYTLLKEKFAGIVSYPANDGVKLAAGWLIEAAGWKGKHLGKAAVHDKQALVLVNTGDANGQEILTLAAEIQKSILNLFGVSLETEVNIIR